MRGACPCGAGAVSARGAHVCAPGRAVCPPGPRWHPGCGTGGAANGVSLQGRFGAERERAQTPLSQGSDGHRSGPCAVFRLESRSASVRPRGLAGRGGRAPHSVPEEGLHPQSAAGGNGRGWPPASPHPAARPQSAVRGARWTAGRTGTGAGGPAPSPLQAGRSPCIRTAACGRGKPHGPQAPGLTSITRGLAPPAGAAPAPAPGKRGNKHLQRHSLRSGSGVGGPRGPGSRKETGFPQRRPGGSAESAHRPGKRGSHRSGRPPPSAGPSPGAKSNAAPGTRARELPGDRRCGAGPPSAELVENACWPGGPGVRSARGHLHARPQRWARTGGTGREVGAGGRVEGRGRAPC